MESSFFRKSLLPPRIARAISHRAKSSNGNINFRSDGGSTENGVWNIPLTLVSEEGSCNVRSQADGGQINSFPVAAQRSGRTANWHQIR